jgi:hypothetical protein
MMNWTIQYYHGSNNVMGNTLDADGVMINRVNFDVSRMPRAQSCPFRYK